MTPPARLRFVRTPSHTLHVADFGGSGPPILLIHGLGGSWSNWAAVAPALAEVGSVLAVDLPGFGSSPPAADYSIDTHVGAATELLEWWGAAGVTVVGNSMGGLVAELLAARAPAGVVRDLVLVAPATPPPLRPGGLDRRVALRLLGQAVPVMGPAALERYVRSTSPRRQLLETLALITADPSSIPADVLEVGVGQSRRRRSMPWAWQAMSASGRDIARRFVDRRGFDRMIASIPTGALVIQGADDRVVPPAGVMRLADIRPDWDLVVWPGVGHVPMLERPAAFARLVRDRVGAPVG